MTNKSNDHIKAKQILEEFIKQHGYDAVTKLQQSRASTIDFTRDLFDRQLEVIEDPSRRVAVLAARRSGKSHLSAYYLVKVCYENPRALCSFTGITRASASEIINPYIEQINERYNLGLDYHISNAIWTFPNGSRICITGADTPREIRKHYGRHYDLSIIDECGEFGDHLEDLVVKVLAPTLIDKNGRLIMIGTPGDVCGGFWYKVSTKKIPVWSVHREWTLRNNPRLPQWNGDPDWRNRAEALLTQIREEEGFTMDSPVYVRQYEGKWTEGGNALIYNHFRFEHNTFRILPEDYDDWTFLLGVDFGHNEPSSIISACYSRIINKLYVVEEYKESGLSPEDMAIIVKSFYDKYNPAMILADGNGIGAAYISQINKMYELPLKLADKQDKAAFIELLNDDFKQGRIKIYEGCKELLKEISTFAWADVELRTLPKVAEDHCLDSLLYLWRHSLHFKGKPKRRTPQVGDPEFEEYLRQLEIERASKPKEPFWKRGSRK